MKRLLLALALIAGIAGFGSSVPASAQIYVRVGPPAPRREYIPPRPRRGDVWVGGHWGWHGGRYAWVGGYWQPGRRGCGWMPGHWAHTWRGNYWVNGHWRC